MQKVYYMQMQIRILMEIFFKGDCRICGKKGHKVAERSVNCKIKNESAYLMTGQKKKCTYCVKENHTVEKCFKKQRDEKNSRTP